jgi:hypothetical protein
MMPPIELLPRMLGCDPKVEDERNLKLENYLRLDKLPIIGDELDWGATQPKPWGVMRNNDLGCCVLSALGHGIQLWTHNRPGGGMVTVPDSAVVKAYQDVGGYVPGRADTDRGTNMLAACKYMCKTGVGGHRATAFVEIDPKHEAMCRAAVQLFHWTFDAYDLPISAQSQSVWDSAPNRSKEGDYKPRSWGGHAVATFKQNRHTTGCITWGYPQIATERFNLDYRRECYAFFSVDALKDGKSILGFDAKALLADLQRVTK